MVFSSVEFLFLFLPLLLIFYFLTVKFGSIEMQNILLVIASLVFYAYGEPIYVFLMAGSIVFNYLMGLAIFNYQGVKNIVLTLAVLVDLALLFLFKYYDFAISNVNYIFRVNFSYHYLILPIGISFYTFQMISYLIDVYRAEVVPQKNILKLALYVCFFPQLIAGPIVQYSDLYKQIERRSYSIKSIEKGSYRFILGMAKKVILANQLGVVADAIMSPESPFFYNIGIKNSWIGVVCYTLQIYFDFSGYSDMAIGLGLIFGFEIMENFEYPYSSKSVREFWRRWHISLSSFFKNYVYIPLGGNQKHTFLNLIIVFFLTGLWHGASWAFVIWGIWHGLFSILERMLKNKKSIFPSYFYRIYTLMVVMIGWVFFKINTIHEAISYIKVMFGLSKQQAAFDPSYYLNGYTIMIILISFYAIHPNFIGKSYHSKAFLNTYEKVYAIILLIICGMSLQSTSYNPFIYFQF